MWHFTIGTQERQPTDYNLRSKLMSDDPLGSDLRESPLRMHTVPPDLRDYRRSGLTLIPRNLP